MLWQPYVALAPSVVCHDGDPKRQRQLRCALFSSYITKLRTDFRGVMPRSDMRGSTLYIDVSLEKLDLCQFILMYTEFQS